MLGRGLSVAALTIFLVLQQRLPAAAHDVGVSLVGRRLDSAAVAIEFALSTGQRAGLIRFQVFAPGEDVPFQDGRTDRLGRATFLPDRPGPWRVQIADYMAYAATETIDIAEGQAAPPDPLWRRWLLHGSLLGNAALGILLLTLLSVRRRRPAAAHPHDHQTGHERGHAHPDGGG